MLQNKPQRTNGFDAKLAIEEPPNKFITSYIKTIGRDTKQAIRELKIRNKTRGIKYSIQKKP